MASRPPKIEDLIDFDATTLRVTSREGKRREFKQQFNTADFSRYTKALAAFCNTDGGVLIFGVAEKPNRVEGVDLATIPDEASWTDRLRKDFDPEIPFKTREYQVDDKTLFAVEVEPHAGRPVICKRDVTAKVEKRGKSTDETVTQQGGIYYRQSGQTRPIAFTELQTLLQERDKRKLQAFLENVEIMQKIGPERIGIFDTSKAAAPGETTKLYVSREVAKSLNFIDKGRFVETDEDGSPAFVVVGTVQLNEVIVGPLDDADKNLPNEAAEKIKLVVEELFGAGTPFTGLHLAKLARHLGIRDGGKTDPHYCIHDKKLKRTFYLRPGIQHVMDKLREQPKECLRSFASKPVIEAYEKQLREAEE
jgi:hypothetical protein